MADLVLTPTAEFPIKPIKCWWKFAKFKPSKRFGTGQASLAPNKSFTTWDERKWSHLIEHIVNILNHSLAPLLFGWNVNIAMKKENEVNGAVVNIGWGWERATQLVLMDEHTIHSGVSVVHTFRCQQRAIVQQSCFLTDWKVDACFTYYAVLLFHLVYGPHKSHALAHTAIHLSTTLAATTTMKTKNKKRYTTKQK